MVFTTKCPQCGKILWFADRLAGTTTICPACGGSMRLEPSPEQLQQAAQQNPPPDAGQTPPANQPAPQPTPPSQIHDAQSSPQPDDSIPLAAEQSLLTHQAAAAAGEVHVDMEESDLVPWSPGGTAPPAPPAPATPPPWHPPPLSGRPPPPPPEEDAWFIPQTTRGPSVLRPKNERTDEGSAGKVPLIIGALVLVTAMIAALVWFLPRAGHGSDWESAHHDEILSLKQSAEQLALEGQPLAAYQKYQELELLIGGHAVQDPHLQEELAKSWLNRDALYQQLLKSGGLAPSPQSQPAVTQESATQESAPPSTQPVSVAPLPPEPPPIAITPTTNPAFVSAMTRPSVHASAPQSVGVTDAQVGVSITKGVDFLLAQFDGPQLHREVEFHDGMDSLAVYALMQAGLSTQDKRLEIHGKFMRDAIDEMKLLSMDDKTQTYDRAIRATALGLYNRHEDARAIRDDVAWLLRAQFGGAYTYSDQFPRQSGFAFWDNSNSQYGLLGVWSGAEAGFPVPTQFWRDVQQHWFGCQLSSGQWTYRSADPSPRRSMTLAGIASLFVTQDYLDAQDWGERVGRPPFSPVLAKALAWLEDGDNSVITHDNEEDWTYTLYGLERAGLASGFKFFGSHDWYREHAAQVIAQQTADGSWATTYGPIADTSFAILFLARGRHPIIMNKLRFAGDWANRPRDAANLARFATAELERPLNWQVVPLDHDWRDWTDSPILYIASDRAANFDDAQQAKIKQFIENGGMLLTQADGDSEEFTSYIQDLGSRLFPQYGWADLPPESPIWNVSYKIVTPPRAQAITNGSRILVLHLPRDVSHIWQLRQEKQDRWAFEFGVNLFLYASGKTELKNRLESDEIPQAATPAAAALRMARLKYDGNWDPEPAAWPRAARWFRQQTNLDLTIEPTAVEDLAGSNPPLAHLTGTAAFHPTDVQLDSLKKYVANGGVLLIDPCGTPGDFLHGVEDDLLTRAFPDARLTALDPSHPLLTAGADGMEDLSDFRVRSFARTIAQQSGAEPSILRSGKGRVIVLPLDLTSGLLGANAWGIAGYTPAYSLRFLKNIVLWTWDGAKDNS